MVSQKVQWYDIISEAVTGQKDYGTRHHRHRPWWKRFLNIR
jgi:hypothetical protein